MVKRYLGDAVYVAFDEAGRLVLTTEDGIHWPATNTIVLEPEVYAALVQYVADLESGKTIHP